MANLTQNIKQASLVIVGGVATRLYMPEKMTLDIDILVKSDEAQLVYLPSAIEDLVKSSYLLF